MPEMAFLRNVLFFMLGLVVTSVVLNMLQEEPKTGIEQPLVLEATATFSLPSDVERVQKCMALNIYREAGNQDIDGMIAVASVVLNRTQSKHFPDDPCDVIYQKRHGVCQFSWVCSKSLHTIKLTDKKGNVIASEDAAWQLSNKIAWQAVLGMLDDTTNGADHYHATYVKPVWRKKMTFTAQIGTHIFYKEGKRA